MDSGVKCWYILVRQTLPHRRRPFTFLCDRKETFAWFRTMLRTLVRSQKCSRIGRFLIIHRWIQALSPSWLRFCCRQQFERSSLTCMAMCHKKFRGVGTHHPTDCLGIDFGNPCFLAEIR